MQPVKLGKDRFRKMLIWVFNETGREPEDLPSAVLNLWWLSTGMAIALKHPEYAHVWVAGGPGAEHWDFLEAADRFVEAVPLEAELPEAG